MTDQEKETNASAPSAAGESQPFGTFGSTRGSGLARGKRTPTPAASAAPAPGGEYKPTALEVIVPQREYQNPFGDPAAAAPEPAPVFTPAPVAPAPVAVAKVAPAPVAVAKVAPAYIMPEPEKPAAELFPLDPESKPEAAPAPAKAALNILPPADSKRPAVSWESDKSPRGETHAPSYPPREERDERPTFRPEPRSGSRPEFRNEPRNEPRMEPRRDQRSSEVREPRRERESTPFIPPAPAPKKSRGFLGWLKDLFGGKKAPQPGSGHSDHRRPEGGFERDGQGQRRRRRGGRGRNMGERGGEHRGPSQEFRGGDNRPREGGERRDDHQQGEHRERRHRGGRGRSRGDNDRGPRSEGHQGGGAI